MRRVQPVRTPEPDCGANVEVVDAETCVDVVAVPELEPPEIVVVVEVEDVLVVPSTF
jgi:hypothetical protein